MALFYPDIILWDDLQMPPILLECIYGKKKFAYLLSRLLLRSPTGGTVGVGCGEICLCVNEFYLRTAF